MICATCGGNVGADELTVYCTHYNGYLITVKGVPGAICPQCGEVWYKSPVLKKVKAIVDKVKETIDGNTEIDFAA